MLTEAQQKVESGASYALGAGGITLGAFVDITSYLELGTLIVAFLVLTIKGAHDGYKFYRDIKKDRG